MIKLNDFRRYTRISLNRRNTSNGALAGEKIEGKDRPRRRWPVYIAFARVRRRLRYLYREWAASAMYLGTLGVYRNVEVHGKENFSYSPSTIVAWSHKRDHDIPVIIPRLYMGQHPNRRKDMCMIYVATRDDVFEEGFWITYFPILDKFRWLIDKINLVRFFRDLQTAPVKLPDEQTVNQLLHETRRIEGNLSADNLTKAWQERIFGVQAGQSGLTLYDAILACPIELLRQYATPEMFTEPLAGRIRERHRRTLLKQLYDISRILDKGGVLYIAPEGRVTPDGRFGKMRAALTRIVQQTRADVKLLPINITYDFMDTQRSKVVAVVGKEIAGIKQLTKNELADLVGTVVPALACVTMSGLGSKGLLELAEQGNVPVRRFQLRDVIWEQLQQLHDKGLMLDSRLTTRQGFEERFERFILFCQRQGNIFKPASADWVATQSAKLHAGDEWLALDTAALRRAECRTGQDHPVRYCYNELMSLLRAHNLDQPPSVKPAPLDFETKVAEIKAGSSHRSVG